MKSKGTKNIRNPERRLLEFFHRNGYVRSPNLTRRKRLGADLYKKGWEIRLVAKSRNELYLIRKLLDKAGLRKGKPFKKGMNTVQPVYGKEAVQWFKSRK
jgi:hypothetical protein